MLFRIWTCSLAPSDPSLSMRRRTWGGGLAGLGETWGFQLRGTFSTGVLRPVGSCGGVPPDREPWAGRSLDTAWPAVVMERYALVDIPVFTGESSLGSLLTVGTGASFGSSLCFPFVTLHTGTLTKPVLQAGGEAQWLSTRVARGRAWPVVGTRGVLASVLLPP